MNTGKKNKRSAFALYGLLSLIGLSSAMTSCKDNDDKYEMPELVTTTEITDNTISFPTEGGEFTLNIKTNRNWHAEAGDTWYTLTPDKGVAGTHAIVIKALPNSSLERKSILKIKNISQTLTLSIKQGGKELPQPDTKAIPAVLEFGKKLAEKTPTPFDQDMLLEAVVVNNTDEGQFLFPGYLHVMDADGHSMVMTTAKGSTDKLTFGDKIKVQTKGKNITNYGGTIQMEVPQGGFVSIEHNQPVTPKEVSIEDVNAGKYDLAYVKITGVQFEKINVPFAEKGKFGNHTLETKDGKKINLEINKSCKFYADQVPEGSGYVMGVITTYNKDGKIIRSIRPSLKADMVMKEKRFDAGGGQPNPNPDPTPGPKTLLFAGSDFEDWNAFLGTLNKYGLKEYATQKDNGKSGKAMQIKTDKNGKSNDYVFTVKVGDKPVSLAGKTKINLYIKGTGQKSLSFALYTKDKKLYVYNLGDVSADKAVSPTLADNMGFKYDGTIDTKDKWVKITLDISSVKDLDNIPENSLFTVKIGSKDSAYDLLLDEITVE
ncbi:DUF5689 domain-containing protein [Porphyromonas pogonae]|uniref:DUF5689 domain-containing protein n=1 Tax=Porphyromonas pogonae TaxID=867595 RepID=UPI002E776F3D|nr:DUF5689 domain-containing protein [Porphyromonas pogonae]